MSAAVYITIIVIQFTGFLLAAFLTGPAKVRRNDGRAIAYFEPLRWRQELKALLKTIMTPWVLLLSLALFSCQMSYSLIGSLNAFYFNARTRALVNVSILAVRTYIQYTDDGLQLCFWMSSACGSAMFALFCDGKYLSRRKRAIIASAIVAALLIGPFAGLLKFLTTHNVNRHMKARNVDWKDGSAFISLLIIYVFLGTSLIVFQGYLVWLCSTFSNEPRVLSRYSGYIEWLKGMGSITAFAIDSNRISFLTEGLIYFSLAIAGTMMCLASTLAYTKDTKYGDEELVIIPRAFEADFNSSANTINSLESDVSIVKKEVRPTP